MIYRSPTWLRWLIDFEICTGEDIKGKPSKRKQSKIDAKIAADRAEANAKRLADEEAARQSQREYERMVREARRQAEENRLKKEKEARQARIDKELNDLYDRMINDWTRNPYTDKVSTPNVRGEVHFHFRFENGDTFKVEGNNLVFSNGKTIATFTTNLFTRSRFVTAANHFTGHSVNRPRNSSSNSKSTYSDFDFDDFFNDFKKQSGQRSSNQQQSNYNKQQSSQSSQSNKDQKARSQNTHPKADRYNSILDTVVDRKRQLAGMKKSDSGYEAMNNELQAAIRTANTMKEKYKFNY